MNNDDLNNFNSEVGSDNAFDNQAANGIENTAMDAANKSKNYVSNKLKNSKTAQRAKKGAKDAAAKATKKVTKPVAKAAAKGAKAVGKKVAGVMAKLVAKGAAVAIKAVIMLVASIGWMGLAIILGVILVAALIGLIIDQEYSRTNDANFQHLRSVDGNKIMNNNLSSQGNVYFNPQTKRYELGQGKMPTEANRLYYVYYAVMAEQSRWFVNYEKNPDWKPNEEPSVDNSRMRPVEVQGSGKKYTLDGYMFNQNDIDKVGLKEVDKDKPATLDGFFDEKAAQAIKKMSLDVNMLYLLDSTMHGSVYGTGKNQIFFGEQFVKPVYHDKNYNFKALTKYRDMTESEKEKYASNAHASGHDGKLETEFQQKYAKFSEMLDTQNKARGGSDAEKDKESNISTDIKDPILAKAVAWGLDQIGKGIHYSQIGGERLGPNFYDCSSFVSEALVQAGVSTNIRGNTTVGLLQKSDAFNQKGTFFKEIPIKDAKAGTIIVAGGLNGGGSNGHTFFLLEDFHGDDTKILQSTPFAYDDSPGGGLSAQGIYKYGIINGSEVALVPADTIEMADGSGGTGSGSSSSGDKDKGPKDVSMSTPNTYKDKISTGLLTAKSREYDTAYNPKFVKGLTQTQDVRYKRWRSGDFYVDQDSEGVVKWDKFTKHTHNSDFKVGGGAITTKSGKARLTKGTNYLGEYTDDRGELVQWALDEGYNPSLLVAMISAITDRGVRTPDVSKYNFIGGRETLVEKQATDAGAEKTDTDTTKDDKDEEKSNPGYDPNYGAEIYNNPSKVNSMKEGLAAMMTKVNEKVKDGKFTYQTLKDLGFDSLLISQFKEAAKDLGFKNDDWKLKGTNYKVYTYNGKDATDPQGLGNISIDGKANDKGVGASGQKRYYTEKNKVKLQDAVETKINDYSYTENTKAEKPKHGYAIARDKDNKPKMKTGVWDYGFGSIFKISKMEYQAWEVSINNEGKYVLENNGNPFQTFFQGQTNKSSDVQYTVLGVTSPFGTINLGNTILEDQDKVDAVIQKMKDGQELSEDDVAIIDGHKTTEVEAEGPGNFIVADKPVIDNNKSPELSDMNGGQYVIDYLMNYKTYIPSVTKTKIDVLNRWKNMNDANADDQEAADKVADIFNKLIAQKQKDSEGGSSTGDVGDLSAAQKEAGQKVYDALIKAGVGSNGAIAIMTNWKAESGFDPTITFGVFDEPFQVGPRDRVNLTNDLPIGLGQWNNGRKQNLLAYAKEKGKDWYDLELQIDFMIHGEPGGPHDVLMKVVQDTIEGGNHGFFMAWEIHGGVLSLYDAPFDDLAMVNNPEEHTSKEVMAQLKKEFVKKEVKPDLEKLNAGMGGGSTSGGSSSSSTDDGVATSNWGDGRGVGNLIKNFLSSVSSFIGNIFTGTININPTMFATDAITNEKPMYKGDKQYDFGTLIINGADAYKWTPYEKRLSEDNAYMVLRQIVASLETRDARPVYYDEIYNRFNSYDLGRIVEENYKLRLLNIFKYTGDTKPQITPLISNPLIHGKPLGETKLHRAYGWEKDGDKIKAHPALTFKDKAGERVDNLIDGKVTYVGNDDNFDKVVIIRSNTNNEQLAYANLGDTKVSVDQQVKSGDEIGTTDSKGHVSLIGVDPMADVSKGLKKLPSQLTNQNDYFNITTLFQVKPDNYEKMVKTVNGYSMKKVGPGKPKVKDFKETKDTNFESFF